MYAECELLKFKMALRRIFKIYACFEDFTSKFLGKFNRISEILKKMEVFLGWFQNLE